jgi:hypothetical protein
LDQALPRLTNRERLVQMVDPALKGQFAVKDLIQVKVPFLMLASCYYGRLLDLQR